MNVASGERLLWVAEVILIAGGIEEGDLLGSDPVHFS
jgi:hypothetical protein